jgi:hypothetical protein
MATAVQQSRVQFDEIYGHIGALSEIHVQKEPTGWNSGTANLGLIRVLLKDLQNEFEETQKQIENPSLLTRLFFMKSLQQKQKENEEALASISITIKNMYEGSKA